MLQCSIRVNYNLGKHLCQDICVSLCVAQEEDEVESSAAIIKKHGNRRLYDTAREHSIRQRMQCRDDKGVYRV